MADVGTELLSRLVEKLMIDDEWIIPRARGFTWWSYRLAQHVEVGQPVSDGALDVCTVRIWTEIVRDADPATNPAEFLGLLNTQATLNALVWHPDNGAIGDHCTAYVHKDNIDWLADLLATAAVIQNASAHGRAHGIAQACGGAPAATVHPKSGPRAEMDEILQMPAQVLAPAGREPSQFAGPAMASVADFLHKHGIVGTASDTEISCQVAFAEPQVAQAEVPVAVVQILTDVPHPEAGNGALVLLAPPESAVIDDPAATANALNLAEAKGQSGVPLLGAWCPSPIDPDTAIAYCSFLPNMVATAGSDQLEKQVLFARNRSMFASQWLD
ncbi:hypothetical protein [Mycolicibacterium brumae]|uniref:Uncharacterized protein n=1 Tax=Mycolicibacterium brumae TaxID=85968 RepID=A0A2G5P687_9MYCO|nr:hypothetical protein [Mycolicibacterium brumae]MCV7194022.1 hypothetical protein [Mycolicibacterium brumae]PIB73776.1 hypothetical protein CQY22_015455 [Mycolicibacterium brumae]RWA19936.1 hypothetical protein MBRU_16090 [Mycolicibacterium brumae DSM 44177]UWW09695.1 hypothetical protein L2Z93_002806 [Mycolicibacterium brumae]